MLKLKDKYNSEVVPQMIERFAYKSKMAVPRIQKVVINTGFGGRVTSTSGEEQRKTVNAVLEDLALIAGQKAVKTYAKKAIAGFKTRKGITIGAKVTLRGNKMYEFLEKLIHVVLPRTRDFNGIPAKALDQQGNLTIGVKEHIVFPEILPERAKNIFGLEVIVVNSAKGKEEALELFKLLGFPIKI